MPTMEKSGRASQNADIESEALKSDGVFLQSFPSNGNVRSYIWKSSYGLNNFS